MSSSERISLCRCRAVASPMGWRRRIEASAHRWINRPPRRGWSMVLQPRAESDQREIVGGGWKANRICVRPTDAQIRLSGGLPKVATRKPIPRNRACRSSRSCTDPGKRDRIERWDRRATASTSGRARSQPEGHRHCPVTLLVESSAGGRRIGTPDGDRPSARKRGEAEPNPVFERAGANDSKKRAF